ncbi:MAG TPA: efflux RND transporter periplasmic adaptor subunit, partial [Candidatus Nitrosotenuis sp.]|nr:efflux RND transporter periplasmic adaptor subunit [Candidatus Nitrosotenuis sp.]
DAELRARVESLESALVAARHELAEARRTLVLRRGQNQAALRQARARSDQARWSLEKARRGPRQAQAANQLALLEEGSRPEDIGVARGQMAEAQAGVQAAVEGFEELALLQERVRAAEARVRELSARLGEARAGLSQRELRASVRAVVVRRFLEAGEVAGPGQPILDLVVPESLWIEAEVDEEDAARVSVGQTVEVTLSALPGQSFPGRVSRVAAALERKPDVPGEVKILRIRVRLLAGHQGIRPGMQADVVGRVTLARGALLAPRQALWRQDGQWYALRLEAGRVHRIPVRLGAESTEQVVVLEGLSEGDRLVTRGREGLADGARVRLLPQP